MIQILGQSGYRQVVSEILAARDQLVRGINELQGLSVLGNPDAYLVSFSAAKVDIMAVSEGMLARGWLTGHLTRPQAIHLFLDRHNATAIPEYLSDLGETLSEVERGLWAGDAADTAYTQ
jgi:sphinganine-1-phosphate aldolase